MIGEIEEDDGDFYFTIAYILMTLVVVAQVIYYSFVVYSYQNIKKKIVEKGRLLQIIPIVSIATVSMQPNHVISCPQAGCSVSPIHPDMMSSYARPMKIDVKDVPPPYAP